MHNGQFFTLIRAIRTPSLFLFIRVHSWLKRRNDRPTKRRAGDSNHRHASRYKSEWRHFRWLGDLANGLGQRDSGGEDGPSARRYGGDGKNVIPAARESRGH